MPSNLIRTFDLANLTLSVLNTNICSDCRDRRVNLNSVVDENSMICGECAERREASLCGRCSSYYSWSTRGLYGLCGVCNPINSSFYHTPNVGVRPAITLSYTLERRERTNPNAVVRPTIVRSYSYKPQPLFFGVGPLFMGVELEVLASSETAGKLHDLSGNRAYLKSDSSIIGQGFEIVTHPMSLDEQLAYWQSALHHTGSELSHNSSCGMHVHISRRPLSQLQIGKVLVFLNNPTNDSWIDLIAGRSSNSYCQRKKKSIEDVGNQSSRYEALNLLNNETIEFRLFASSNKENEILYRIEFCHAVVMWAEEAALDQLEWSFFMDWLYKSTEDLYPYLKEELSCWRAGRPQKTLKREVVINPNVLSREVSINPNVEHNEVDYGGWNGDADGDYCPVTRLSWDEIRQEEDVDNIPF